jgi:hypothetical protein
LGRGGMSKKAAPPWWQIAHFTWVARICGQ